MDYFVFKFLFRYVICLIYLEMSLEDDTMFCIEVEDDSRVLWHDVLAPWHMGSGGHGGVCPICEQRISTKLKRHVEREHLPWWFNPTNACWSCKQSVTSACFLRREHAHCTLPIYYITGSGRQMHCCVSLPDV